MRPSLEMLPFLGSHEGSMSPSASCSGNQRIYEFHPVRMSPRARQTLIPYCPFQIYARSFFPYCLHLLISSWLPDFRHYPLIWQVQRYSTFAVSALMQTFPWSASFPAPQVASQSHLPFGSSPNTLYQMPPWLKAVGKHQKYFQGPNCKLHFNFDCRKHAYMTHA